MSEDADRDASDRDHDDRDHDEPWAGSDGIPGAAFLSPPAGYRPSGTPPYFEPGQGILWRYRRPHGSGAVRPVRVVSDDADGLVVWLAAATEIVVAALPDGRPLRSVTPEQMFVLGRSRRRAVWEVAGTLKVAPTGMPWSAWRFPSDQAGTPDRTWYVNLEDPHCRDADGVLTQDHVLDVVIRPDGEIVLKDADELEAAVAAGRFSVDDARRIEQNADEVRAVVRRRVPPFDGSLDDWEPDPAWTPVPLPADLGSLPLLSGHDPVAHLRAVVGGAGVVGMPADSSHSETTRLAAGDGPP